MNPCLLSATSLSSPAAGWRCGSSSTSYRNHIRYEEPSGAASLEKCISLRIPWDEPVELNNLQVERAVAIVINLRMKKRDMR